MVCKKIHALDWHLLGDLRRAATGETQMRTDDDAVHRPAAPCRDRERRETRRNVRAGNARNDRA